jgi:hypothetical protein
LKKTENPNPNLSNFPLRINFCKKQNKMRSQIGSFTKLGKTLLAPGRNTYGLQAPLPLLIPARWFSDSTPNKLPLQPLTPAKTTSESKPSNKTPATFQENPETPSDALQAATSLPIESDFTKTYLKEFKQDILMDLGNEEESQIYGTPIDEFILTQMMQKFNVSDSNDNKIPDYVYSTAIMTLIKGYYLHDAYNLLIRASLDGTVLDLGLFYKILKYSVLKGLDESYMIIAWDLMSEHLVPNKKM